VHVLPRQLNTYDVLVSDDVVFTDRALRAFLGRRPRARAKAVARGVGRGRSTLRRGTLAARVEVTSAHVTRETEARMSDH
jgi:hypothetical protein